MPTTRSKKAKLGDQTHTQSETVNTTKHDETNSDAADDTGERVRQTTIERFVRHGKKRKAPSAWEETQGPIGTAADRPRLRKRGPRGSGAAKQAATVVEADKQVNSATAEARHGSDHAALGESKADQQDQESSLRNREAEGLPENAIEAGKMTFMFRWEKQGQQVPFKYLDFKIQDSMI